MSLKKYAWSFCMGSLPSMPPPPSRRPCLPTSPRVKPIFKSRACRRMGWGGRGGKPCSMAYLRPDNWIPSSKLSIKRSRFLDSFNLGFTVECFIYFNLTQSFLFYNKETISSHFNPIHPKHVLVSSVGGVVGSILRAATR